MLVDIVYYSVENEGSWGENGIGRCRRVVAKLGRRIKKGRTKMKRRR